MRRELHLVVELETLCKLINSSKVCQVVVVVVNLLVLLVLVVVLTVFLSVIFTALQIARKSFYCLWGPTSCARSGGENIIINLSQLFLVCHAPFTPLHIHLPVKHLAKFCLLRR